MGEASISPARPPPNGDGFLIS